jgi:hypothetical protein
MQSGDGVALSVEQLELQSSRNEEIRLHRDARGVKGKVSTCSVRLVSNLGARKLLREVTVYGLICGLNFRSRDHSL